MIQTIQDIYDVPKKYAQVHELKGDVKTNGRNISVGGVLIPSSLRGRFLERCSKYDTIQDAVDDRSLYLRGNQKGWFGLVTDEFHELPIADIAQSFDTDVIARYIPEKERVLLNIPMGEIPTPVSKQDGFSKKMHFYVDSGDFGTYGGNGRSALKYGVSVHDGLCTNWTLFLSNMFDGDEKVIHKTGYPTIEGLIEKMTDFSTTVKEKWSMSDTLMYPTQALEAYFKKYGLSTGNSRWLAKEMDLSKEVVSAYDIAWELTHKAQKRSSFKQAQMEMLAGELIICYDSIMEECV